MPKDQTLDVWPDVSLSDHDSYRSEYDRRRIFEVFGTESPVVLITGSAADRVGCIVARHFAARGYRVVFHAHHSVQRGQAMVNACDAAGIPSMLVEGDVSDETAVRRWMQQIRERFDRLDAVVHCAATWERQRLEDTAAATVERNLREHTLAAFLICQNAGLMMTQQPSGGSIVLIGDWAIERPYPNFAAYFAGKATVPTLTRTFAVELGTRRSGVRVNCILPGTILLGPQAEAATEQRLADATLVGRIGSPDDVAAAAVFLSENTFLSGVSMPVDGGRHCWAGPGIDAIAHPEES